MNGTDFPLRAIDLERLGISLRFVNTDDEGTRARAMANAHLLNASKDLLNELQNLVALVRGECPSLLNEDSGGCAALSIAIDDAIAKALGEQA